MPAPPVDPPHTAAVGWAPAMRAAVITVLAESKAGSEECPGTTEAERAGDEPTSPSREPKECVRASTPPSTSYGRDDDGG